MVILYLSNIDVIEDGEETNADIFAENVFFFDDFNYSLPKHNRCAAYTLN